MITYKKRILEYCQAHGIQIPGGFGRNSPLRYCVILTYLEPPKLVATTGFKTSDVIHYLRLSLVQELGDRLNSSIQILDFKDNVKMVWYGSKQLVKTSTF